MVGMDLPRSPGFEEAAKIRRYETRDIARRLGTISPDRLFINGFPAKHSVAVFNPGLLLDEEEREVILYPRIIVGYYKYVSAIAEARIPVEDVLSGQVSLNMYSANLVVSPSNKYDFWGAEDPRAFILRGRRMMTYTGRTINYFEAGDRDRTLPVTAVEAGGRWVKALVARPTPRLVGRLISDKNAFLLDVDGFIFLFHRAHEASGEFLLLASRLRGEAWRILESPPGDGPAEVLAEDDWHVMPAARFEEKIAWGAPPIHLGGREYLFLLHGVGREMQVYRVFALLAEVHPREGPIVKAVTPRYIMEPREPYETFGDRPYTVFPCGAARLGESILVSYGAADYMASLALLPMDEVMAELDKGRIL